MRVGTAHFVSQRAAVKYYEAYGNDAADVAAKLAAGEIFIGPPELQPGERLHTDEDGRYHIESGRV